MHVDDGHEVRNDKSIGIIICRWKVFSGTLPTRYADGCKKGARNDWRKWFHSRGCGSESITTMSIGAGLLDFLDVGCVTCLLTACEASAICQADIVDNLLCLYQQCAGPSSNFPWDLHIIHPLHTRNWPVVANDQSSSFIGHGIPEFAHIGNTGGGRARLGAVPPWHFFHLGICPL